LFGRMVTSDPEANTDAAIHVAQAGRSSRSMSTRAFRGPSDETSDLPSTGCAGTQPAASSMLSWPGLPIASAAASTT
jgi:hypothetical protein